jgi:glycosyltransferase involved in cell wall biosynthesis
LMPGGEETSVARIARHLERGGHRVTPFWRCSAEWTGPGAPAKLRQLFLMWRNSAILSELAELNSREKPDGWIVHNVVPVISLGVYRLAQELRVPILQWLHNYRPLSPSGTLRAGDRQLQPDDRWIALKETVAGSWRGRFLTGWLSLAYALCRRRGGYENVRAWIAVSEEMKSIFERGGWPRHRLFALRHSWDMQGLPTPPLDKGYFLFLGRLVEPKGVRFLVELWRRPALQGVPLVLAGEGELYDELRQQESPDIRCVGYVQGEEKRRLIAGCRAIVFPCLWPEPLSTVAYEAYESA